MVYDDIHWLHQDPRNHPENPHRLEIVVSSLKKHGLTNYIEWAKADKPDNSVLLVHDESYVLWIREESMKGFHYIDPDTYVTRDTYRVATSFSASARSKILRSIEKREIWVILPRPPGHHAGFKGRALGAPTLGFCIFNHVAVAARSVLDTYKDSRILIIDFDAHHGNGTQEIFWREPRVIHVDIHEYGAYPGTGDVDDIGSGKGLGTKINIPVKPYTGDDVYVWVLNNVVQPLVEKYRFKTVIVSAGFDSYMGDPLTELGVTEKGFYLYGRFLREVFEDKLVDSILIVLEGGYEAGLRYGFPAFIKGLLGLSLDTSVDVKPKPPPRRVYAVLKSVLEKYHGIEVKE